MRPYSTASGPTPAAVVAAPAIAATAVATSSAEGSDSAAVRDSDQSRPTDGEDAFSKSAASSQGWGAAEALLGSDMMSKLKQLMESEKAKKAQSAATS
ncbi:hypothetical protein PHYSODRAFT_337371 [Phytophthora sojae]|uniref:Uncharacterized protein n=1 Tax=Phytophthora sojae (strain P6497) TaxID=1094619 RepID=G5A0P0_PHYSP|nr:hypothetical protein PHYSODRAFT_337371 [Phytophthora sojae]EGZ10576.1 hypothetical protein PHYSODRAFT_337371 [Phytophthora sojae]|eukprot:XP_009533321.1 hypothetical protein PHYSODRAFT_337371 [Phytophthora sojae]